MPMIAGEERDRLAPQLYDKVAGLYDDMNRDMSEGADAGWRRHVLRLVPMRPDMNAVDLGTGTGEFYLLLRQQIGLAGSVIALDRSSGMLDVARAKAEAALPGLPHDLRLVDSYDTRLPSNSTDLITLGWVLRSVGNRQALYDEALRILRPGGILLSLEAFAPGFAPLRWIHDAYIRTFMDKRIRRYLKNDRSYYEFVFSENEFPTLDGLKDEWTKSGFTNVTARQLTFVDAGFTDLGTRIFAPLVATGIAVHLGQKPQ